MVFERSAHLKLLDTTPMSKRMTKLDGGLNQTFIDRETRQEIISALWPESQPGGIQDNLDLDPYFRYYTRQCHHALVDRGQHVFARTHQNIVDIVEQIEEQVPREAIRENLRCKLLKRNRTNEDEILDAAIDLAARLHLMINVTQAGPFISGQIPLHWESGTLKDCLAAHFSEPQVLSSDGIKLEPTFTAANLERIAGIQIRPTDNLADHLRMIDKDDKIVAVFTHVSFLKRHKSKSYPPTLLHETLQTLSLLFPQHDSQTRSWLLKHNNHDAADENLDTLLTQCPPLRLQDRQLEAFPVWRDRLIILKQAFDHSRPGTMGQWWYDRRNGVQWYTFWVAVWVLILTVFFGLVQSVEGGLQVWKAYHPI